MLKIFYGCPTIYATTTSFCKMLLFELVSKLILPIFFPIKKKIFWFWAFMQRNEVGLEGKAPGFFFKSIWDRKMFDTSFWKLGALVSTSKNNFWKFIFAKGQSISKCLFGALKLNVSQKANGNKSTWGIIALKSNFFVHFWENWGYLKVLLKLTDL